MRRPAGRMDGIINGLCPKAKQEMDKFNGDGELHIKLLRNQMMSQVFDSNTHNFKERERVER